MGAAVISWLTVVLMLAFVGAANAAERYAVIIGGASGGAKYAAQQHEWQEQLTNVLAGPFAFPRANLVVLDERTGGSGRATAENVRRLFADLHRRVTRDDTLLVVLFGHGTFDGEDAKFNLVGPDLSAAEWNGLLDGMAGRLVLVNTTESSFPFIEQLSQRGRIVITATDSAGQRFATVFPEYFVRAVGDAASDVDKDGRTSIWEAFVSASVAVRQYYERQGQLSTERPLLDDDGNRTGREAEAPGEDGAFARAVFLDAERSRAAGDDALAALERERADLQRQLDELKLRKPLLPDQEYQTELERLLIEIARVSQRIRSRS